MADEINLLTLDIDTNKVVKKSADLRKELEKQKVQLKEIENSTGKTSEEYVQQEAKVKGLNAAYNQNQRVLTNLTNIQGKNITTVKEARTALAVVSAQWAELTKVEGENSEAAKKLGAQKTELTKRIGELEKATGDGRRGVGLYADGILEAVAALRAQEAQERSKLIALKNASRAIDISTERQGQLALEISNVQSSLVKTNKELKKYGENLDISDAEIIETNEDVQESNTKIQSSFSQLVPALGSAGQGVGVFNQALNVLRANPIIFVITALVGALKLLFDAFKRNQEGADILNRGLAGLKAAFAVLQDIAWKFAVGIVKAFKDPQQAMKDFANLIKTNIQNRIQGLIDSVGILGKILGNVFKGEFKQAAENAKDLGQSLIQVGTGLDKATQAKIVNGIKNISKEMREEASAARDLEAAQQSLEDREIAFIKTKAQLTKAINAAKLAAADQTKSERERLAVLDEAIRLEEQLSQQEVALANERARISQQQINLGESTREEIRANAQLQAEAVNKEAEALGRLKEIYGQRSGLVKALNAEQQKAYEEAQENLLLSVELEKQVLNSQQQYKFELLQEEVNRKGQNLFDQAELERQFLEEKTIREEERITAEQEQFTQELENKRQIELQAADLTGANKQAIIDKYNNVQAISEATTAKKIQNIRLKQANAEVAIDKKVNQAKLDLAQGALGNIAQIAGKNSKIGKAAAVAATTIETFKGAQSAFSSLAGIPIVGPVLGALAAAAAIAGGVANVRSIIGTKSGLPGEGSVSAPPISNSLRASPVSTDGGAIAGAQNDVVQSSTEATQAAISASLQENPNVLVIEDVENVKGRQTEVVENASF